ncbi:hypothetical protein CAXC1_170011 [Candidatus Xenohaliotis californiensis]|uniref:Methionyl-tRNA formyltransferase n=1 Tax=Candidatus Xenohaliotis californiensis TaxID=84677 RepID=A0ABP0EVF5_9RICK|nr:hypothetical protein CAXC1_170011 [Candidatus Xenohaliotis californiensis]
MHPSLLPRFRGPSPIRYAVLSGEKRTGVTLMFMDAGMDTGDIIAQEEIEILDDDYTALSKRLVALSIKMTHENLPKIFSRNYFRKFQDHDIATYTMKFTKKDALIDWQEDCTKIIQKIRAFTPNAFFYHNGDIIKIIKANYRNCEHQKICGTIDINNMGFDIYCKNGLISPLILQRAGKKPLMVKDFLLGYKIK